MATVNPARDILLLAYRQAKQALVAEKSAVGLEAIADFEMQLPQRLRELRQNLASDQWFDQLVPGSVAVIPKAVRTDARPDEIVRVGEEHSDKFDLSVRLQLVPSPQFSIAEVLYLWEFGPALEALLEESCVGYRLKRVSVTGAMDPHDRDLYEYWPAAFERYREDPIRTARAALKSGDRILIISTDVANYFDSIVPRFLTSKRFVESVASRCKGLGRKFDSARYLVATKSLLRAFGRFRKLRLEFGNLDVTMGVPIGSLTSRLIGNVVLASFDAKVSGAASVICYRRYVDDIVVVRTLGPGEKIARRADAMDGLFPGFLEKGDVSLFRDPLTKVQLTLKNEKTRIHELHGEIGVDFLHAVQQNFSVVASERRAFFGNVERLEQEVDSVVDLFGPDQLDRIPRLRDADHFTLRRFIASAVVLGLQRAAILLDPAAASAFVQKHVRRTLSVLDSSQQLDDFEFVLSLLRVSLICKCGDVTDRLANWLSERLSPKSRKRIGRVTWCGVRLRRETALEALQAYLMKRIAEVAASSCIWESSPKRTNVADGGISLALSGPAPSRLARRLFTTGLRYLDRELDVEIFGHPREKDALRDAPSWQRSSRLLTELKASPRIAGTLDEIARFIELSRELGEAFLAKATSVGTLLSSRPPSYFDVARRMLARLKVGEPTNVGRSIDRCVDALRGTRYSLRRKDWFTFHAGERNVVLRVTGDRSKTTRVILANLKTDVDAFERAVNEQPVLSLERLRRLDCVLRDAKLASEHARRMGISSLLVLPELSIPTRWVRQLARHAVQAGISLIGGVEYAPDGRGGLFNQAVGIFPAAWRSVAVVRWTKTLPADSEGDALWRAGKHLSGTDLPRLVIHSAHGRIGVLICSELLDASAMASLVGDVELLVVPAWNKDTSSFDHVAHSAATTVVHAFVCISNNADSSDSRIIAPIREPRHLREWCRLIHRDENTVVWGDLPTRELREFHNQRSVDSEGRKYFALPPSVPRRRTTRNSPTNE